MGMRGIGMDGPIPSRADLDQVAYCNEPLMPGPRPRARTVATMPGTDNQAHFQRPIRTLWLQSGSSQNWFVSTCRPRHVRFARSFDVKNTHIERLHALNDRLSVLVSNLIGIWSGYLDRTAHSDPELQKGWREFQAEGLARAARHYGGEGYFWTPPVLDTPREKLVFLFPWLQALQAGVSALLALMETSQNLAAKRDVLVQIAKAQAGVRAAASLAGLPIVREQEELFGVLKVLADRYGRIPKWMTITESPDPTDLDEVQRLTSALYGVDQRWIDNAKVKIRRAAAALRNGTATDQSSTLQHCLDLTVTVGALVRFLAQDLEHCDDGPTLDAMRQIVRERRSLFAETLLPPILALSEFGRWHSVDREFGKVMTVLCEPLSPPPLPRSDGAERERLCAEAIAIANGLANSSGLFLGGECNEPARQRIERDLGLARLDWPTIRPHSTSLREATDLVRSGRYRVVILASGFADHAMSELRKVCRDWGVAFVQLPARAGYGTNTLAHHIMTQAGRDLGLEPPG